MAKYKHKCKHCGEQFEDYCQSTLFCSRKCYYENRRENKKYGNIICPVCGKEFKQQRQNHMFCSVECRIKATEKKMECICNYCGKSFMRKEPELIKNKRHYCSEECKRNGMYWSEKDTNLLINNFGSMTYKEMANMFTPSKTIDEIKRRAIYIGLTESQQWKPEEVEILVKYYSTIPIQQVMDLLPNKTLMSIRGQAKAQNIKSFYYLSRIYTLEEEEYLRLNYLEMSNEQLGGVLNRSPSAIEQHLWIMGLKRPKCIDSYTNIAEYIRSRLYVWKNEIKEKNNYTCALSGLRSNIVVHHIRGFNILLTEAIENINIPIYTDLS